jgi:peptide/nickel transport system permease protein
MGITAGRVSHAPELETPGLEPQDPVAVLATPRGRAWRSLRANPAFWTGVALVAFMAAAAVLAPVLAPHDPNFQFRRDEAGALIRHPLGPSAMFPFGTDPSGRDYLSRLLFGARTSLVIGIGANLIATVVGVAIGSVAGFVRNPQLRLPFGRTLRIPVESLLMRLTDLALAFPALLLAIALAAVLRPSVGLVIGIIAGILWATTARIVYGRVLILGEAEFVEAARAVGVSNVRILSRHVLPHVAPLVVVYGSLGIAATILFETSLSFLGAGVPARTPSWGTMISDHITWYATEPRLVALPGLAIMITILGFTLLGDALRDALDPHGHR